MTEQSASHRMRVFVLIWFGQVISTFGSGLTTFALGVWVFQKTESATLFALIAVSGAAPAIITSPLAGALVDRWSRRRIMIGSDVGAGLATLAIVVLLRSEALQIWHLYVAVACGAAAGAFQWPAFSAATTLLVPKKHLARASGMVQMGAAAAGVLAPLIAGLLYVRIGLDAVIMIDVATFLFAVLTLFLVRIPPPPTTAEGAAGGGSLIAEMTYGWTYIRQRKGLLGLLTLFAGFNLCSAMIGVVLTPLILSFADAPTLGRVLAVAGLGVVTGGLAMAVWGGPRRRINGIYVALAFQGVIAVFGGLRESVPLIATAAFAFMFGAPIINGCSQAIWQSKVAPDVQGRVFAFRRMIALCAMPLGQLLAGPLVDYVYQPLLVAGGPLAATVGRIVGVGPSRGAGLLFTTLGVVMLVLVLLGHRYPRLRNVETEIPDAIVDETPAAAAEDAAPAP